MSSPSLNDIASRTFRPKVLVLLSDYSWADKNVVAATLSWMASQAGWLSDVYYDAYRIGDHFGGGDIDEPGKGFGSLLWSGRHLERFLLLNSISELHVVVGGSSALYDLVPDDSVAGVTNITDPTSIYKAVVVMLDIQLPKLAVWIGAGRGALTEIDAYCYPDICSRRALGFNGQLSPEAAKSLAALGVETIAGLFCTDEERETALRAGFEWTEIDRLLPDDGYGTVSTRIARRCWQPGAGFFAGDPVDAAYWLPWNSRRNRLSVYGEPQADVLLDLTKELEAGPGLILGRQYDDRDFMIISQRSRSLQVVDPVQPAFPVIADIEIHPVTQIGRPTPPSPSDDELEAYAREGKILSSLLFWSGAIRELENVERLFELAVLSRLRMGMILTSESFRFGWPYPLRSIDWPVERGGVFPLVEIVLGSFGEGIGFESYANTEVFRGALTRAREEISRIAGVEPLGWWPTLDGKLVRLGKSNARLRGRPYGDYTSGHPSSELWDAVRSAGIKYAFSTYGFGQPAVLRKEKDFIVLTETAGRWEGWSPFVDVASICDIQQAEIALTSSGEPGWLIGTMDSCLWTFTNSRWTRGSELFEMAQLLVSGGESGRLINVTPETVARYARILVEKGYLAEGAQVRSKMSSAHAYLRWKQFRVRDKIRRWRRT